MKLIFILFLTLFFFQFAYTQSKDSEYLKVNGSMLYNLTDTNFNNITRLALGKKNWFVMFYAPWCPHCKRYLPTWMELANNFTDVLNFAIVDCEQNRHLKDRFTVTAYPSLIFLAKGKFYEYKEKRDPESIVNFALNDFKLMEGEDIPMEANFWRSAYKSIGKVTIIGIVVVFIILGLCCICMVMAKDDDEEEEKKELKIKKKTQKGD